MNTLSTRESNLLSIIESGVNVSITFNSSDLVAFGNYIIQKTKNEMEEAVILDKSETYPTPKWVSEYLNVNESTLWRWAKRGYLVPVEVGGKRRYKMSEVKAVLTGGRNHG
jgi:excisionase family DNA binding protein